MKSAARRIFNQALNTFGLDVSCKSLIEIRRKEDFLPALEEAQNRQQEADRPIMMLGGGSNVLFTADYQGSIILVRSKGIDILDDNGEEVLVQVQAGVVWHDLVQWAVSEGLGGIENLALIPGLCGAAPIQNIGAYGVELVNVFHSLEAIRKSDGAARSFGLEECAFGYRDSIFKRAEKGQWIITSISLRLSRKPQLNTSYGAIKETLESRGIENPGIADVASAVEHIRRSKLPDPAEIGNSGSFFKNPELDAGLVRSMLEKHPEMPHYLLSDGRMKIPAAWLIDQCGWKGHDRGGAGVHDRQALVLVNRGGASGHQLVELSRDIQDSVYQRFEISLAPEVNII